MTKIETVVCKGLKFGKYQQGNYHFATGSFFLQGPKISLYYLFFGSLISSSLLKTMTTATTNKQTNHQNQNQIPKNRV